MGVMLKSLLAIAVFWALLLTIGLISTVSGPAPWPAGGIPKWIIAPWSAVVALTEIRLQQQDLATLIAGFGGTALGGFISWVIAKQTAIDTRRRDHDARSASEKAAALKMTLKFMQVANGIYTIHQNIEAQIKLARSSGDRSAELWKKVKSISATSPPVFNADDFVPLAEFGSAELIADIMLSADRYAALSEGLNLYSQRRLVFFEFAAPHTKMSPQSNAQITEFPPETRNQAEVRANELEQLIAQLRANARADHVAAVNICRKLNRVLQLQFKDRGGFIRIDVTAEARPATENGDPGE